MLEVAGEMGVELSDSESGRSWRPASRAVACPRRGSGSPKGWGAYLHDGYGLTEMLRSAGPARCLRHSTSSATWYHGRLWIPTGQPVPAGEAGEAVYTNLVGDTQPLLRYRSRDIARVATDDACACGFTGTRLANSIEGRVDDMIWFRGVNVFPSAVEAVVVSFEELGHQYQIVVEGDRTLPTMTVRVEVTPVFSASADLGNRLLEALSGALRVRPRVELLALGVLPRIDARRKSRPVEDRRHPGPVAR